MSISTKRKLGDSNPRYDKLARQFSKLLVSATHPNFHSGLLYRSILAQMRLQRYAFIFIHANFYEDIFLKI